jgi:hypothetical protein
MAATRRNEMFIPLTLRDESESESEDEGEGEGDSFDQTQTTPHQSKLVAWAWCTNILSYVYQMVFRYILL